MSSWHGPWRPIKDAERVKCPKCGEEPPWACRAKSGRTTDPHVARYELAYRTPRDEWWSAPASHTDPDRPPLPIAAGDDLPEETP